MKYKYCKNIEEIENYAAAAADNFIGWDIHHRLETHNSDGERRTVDLSKAELVALGTYYDRPASELIFLKHGDHMRLHRLNQSSETRAKIGAANRGKHLSDETRAKLREAWKHRAPVSAETRAKMREAWKHRVPVSAETRAKMSETAKHRSEETRAKMRASHLGKHFSDETRAKLREAMRGHSVSSEARAKISASVKLRRAKTSAKN